MTIAEFEAVAEGFRRFHSGKDESGDAPSDDDFLDALADAMAHGRVKH